MRTHSAAGSQGKRCAATSLTQPIAALPAAAREIEEFVAAAGWDLVYVDDAAGLMFAGDHVLPHITPSIGLEAARTDLPLGDFLDSLQRVRELPDMRLLPAHGPVTGSVHQRVDELLDHHDRRLADTAKVVERGACTAYEAARALTWTRRERAFADLDPFNQMMAVLETAAHLDVLALRGRLRREDVDGVVHYAS